MWRQRARLVVWIVALPAAFRSVAVAQERSTPSEQSPPTTTNPMSLEHRIPQPVGWTDPTFILDSMTEELRLDESQRQTSRQLLIDYRARQIAIRKSFQPPSEDLDRTRQLLAEMRVAQENQDEAKIKELTEKLRQLRAEQESLLAPLRRQLQEAQEALHRDLLTLMREDQKEGFERIWHERMIERRGYSGRVRSPKALKDAVDKLNDLTPDQREQIQALFKEHMESERRTGITAGARDRLASRLYDAVIGLLTPEQRKEVTTMLAGRDVPAASDDSRPRSETSDNAPK